jgi:chromate reductase, NAD(P)H dehydrogenase (quinone)
MRKIIAIGGSNSLASINQKFAVYAANCIVDAEVEVLDLNDFEFPIYSIDREKLEGFPSGVDGFIEKLALADGIVLSLAEHNGTYTVAFKNIMDWASRRKLGFFAGKQLLLLSTSPGGFGGGNVMEAGLKRLPKFDANIVAQFSLPKFNENFDSENGIKNEELKVLFDEQMNLFKASLE